MPLGINVTTAKLRAAGINPRTYVRAGRAYQSFGAYTRARMHEVAPETMGVADPKFGGINAGQAKGNTTGANDTNAGTSNEGYNPAANFGGFDQIQGDNIVRAIDTLNRNVQKLGMIAGAEIQLDRAIVSHVQKSNHKLDEVNHNLNGLKYAMLSQRMAGAAANDNLGNGKGNGAGGGFASALGAGLGSALSGVVSGALGGVASRMAGSVASALRGALAFSPQAIALALMAELARRGINEFNDPSRTDLRPDPNGLQRNSDGSLPTGAGAAHRRIKNTLSKVGGTPSELAQDAEKERKEKAESGWNAARQMYQPNAYLTKPTPYPLGGVGSGLDNFGLQGPNMQPQGDSIGPNFGMPNMMGQGQRLGVTGQSPASSGGRIHGGPINGMNAERAGNMRATYQGFVDAGLSPDMARAMTVHVGRENDFKSNNMFGDHRDPKNGRRNVGMFSWQGGRENGLMEYMHQNGHVENGKIKRTPEAIRAQAAYAMQEMERNYPEVYKDITSGKLTYEQAVERIGTGYVKWAANDPRYSANGYAKMERYGKTLERDQARATASDENAPPRETPKNFGEIRGRANQAVPSEEWGDPRDPNFRKNNLTTIELDSGKTVTVNKFAADAFRGFLNELERDGYQIDSLGGHSHRNKVGGGGVSQHAFGNAIDVNPSRNPYGRNLITDMPSDISQRAARYGLSWGGDWKSVKDAMHFEYTGIRPQFAERQRQQGQTPQERNPIQNRGFADYAGHGREERKAIRRSQGDEPAASAQPEVAKPTIFQRTADLFGINSAQAAPAVPTPAQSDASRMLDPTPLGTPESFVPRPQDAADASKLLSPEPMASSEGFKPRSQPTTGDELIARSFQTSTEGTSKTSDGGGNTTVNNVTNGKAESSGTDVDSRDVPPTDWPYRAEAKELFN